MSLIKTINADFITAFKSGAEGREKKDFLGLVKSEVTKKTKEPSDDEVVGVIKSMVKNHNKSLDENNTPTLNEMELEILNGYLPEQYSEERITEIVSEIIASVDNKNTGFVMGMFQKEHKGKADNKLVSKVIREQLV